MRAAQPDPTRASTRPWPLPSRPKSAWAWSKPGTDGRAPLGPVLREFIVSEAMHALGVPTTARNWRTITRTIFESYFQRGYVVTGFSSSLQSRLPNLYRLERESFPAPIDFSAWANGVSEE